MQEWYRSTDLAGLPSMPGTPQGVLKKAKSAGWKARKRPSGKGQEYHLSSLPRATQTCLMRTAIERPPESEATTEDVPAALPMVSELTDAQRAVMQARLAVCSLIDETAARGGLRGWAPAIDALLESAAAGDLPDGTLRALHAANARGSRIPSPATVYRWLEQREVGPSALAPKSPPKSPPPTWAGPLLSLYQRPQKHSISACLREWRTVYPDRPVPPARTAQRWLSSLPVEVREYGRRGKRALRAVQPFVRRSIDGLWPMDVVTVDGHLFKAYVRHPLAPQLKIRPEVTTYVDIATRRAVGFSAWLAESQMAIWAALREMTLDPACGVLAIHYSDNGAYRGELHRSVIERLGGTLMYSEGYRPQARGVIERLNSSVWVPLARHFDTYVNDDSDPEATKKALTIANRDQSNLMDWQDFIGQARTALADYNARPHSELKRRATPDQAWSDAVSEGWRPTLLDGDSLHDLLPSTTRTVQRGEIRLPWGRYYSDDLAPHHGNRVQVGIHPTDGARVWVSDERGALICVAERDGNARPYVPQSMLEDSRHKREQGKLARLERKALDARREAATILTLSSCDVSTVEPLTAPAAAHIEQADQDETDAMLRDLSLGAAIGPLMRRLKDEAL